MNNYDLETEKAVLGAIILENNAFDEVSHILSPDCFYNTANSLVYTAITKLSRDNKPIDMITTMTELKELGLLDQVGGAYYLTDLTSKVAAASNIKHHAMILDEYRIHRNIIKTAEQVLTKKDSNVDDLLELLRSNIESIEESSSNDNPTSLKDSLQQTISDLQNQNLEMSALTTGFNKLDSWLGHMKPGRMYVVGGRPGQGKTSIALHMAIENVKEGKNCLFLSLEQDIPDLTKKILSSMADLPNMKLETGNLQADDWTQIDNGITQIHSLKGNIYIKDSPKDINHIAAVIRAQKKRTGLDMVIIDYLQLIPTVAQKNRIREQEVAEMSRKIKQLSMSENLVIIALSQLNRDTMGEPKLSNLRESGAIEQDADVVLLLHRDIEGYTEDSIIIVAKNRRGQTGKLNFYHQNMNRFSDEPF